MVLVKSRISDCFFFPFFSFPENFNLFPGFSQLFSSIFFSQPLPNITTIIPVSGTPRRYGVSLHSNNVCVPETGIIVVILRVPY